MFRNYYSPYYNMGYHSYRYSPGTWLAWPSPVPNFNIGTNAIGSQFNNQNFVNTGIATDVTQIQSPVNIF